MQTVLTELVGILQGEMLKIQSIKKKQQEEDDTKKEKQIARYKHQIDLILQKHNQEIAKIHALKDVANSKRSERVVYSNLFKKLQKELKHFQQIYKESLIASEIMHNAPAKSLYQVGGKGSAVTELDQKRKNVQEMVKRNYQKHLPNSKINTLDESGWKGFITTAKQNNLGIHTNFGNTNNKKHTYRSYGEDQPKTAGIKQQKLNHTKLLLKNITEFTSQIQKIKVHSQFSNVQDILSHYSHIQKSNKQILDEISEIDNKICETIQKCEQLGKMADVQQFVQEGGHTHPSSPMGMSTVGQDSELIQQEEHRNLVKQLAEELNVQSATESTSQILKLIDQKIEQLTTQHEKTHKNELKARQDTMISETIVDCLLQRMQKYGNCERIFDRNLFKQEYHKQLNKRRGRGKK